jgi:hypothetical protein
MNHHDDIRKLLSAYSAYSGGDLEPAGRLRVEKHCAECAECRAELADLQTALRLIRATPEVEPPPWLATRVMARVREQQLNKQSWLQRIFFPLHIKLPLEAMALLLVCVSGYYMARNVETGLQQPAVREETVVATQESGKRDEVPAQKPKAAPPPSAPPAPAANKEPGTEVKAPPRPAASKAVDQAAPQHVQEYSGSPSVQFPFAPAPPAMKEERAAPAAEPSSDSANSLLGSRKYKAAKRAKSAEPTIEMKGFGTADAGKSISETAAVAQPPIRIRLHLTAPDAAPESLREAVTRSGGSLIFDDGHPRPRFLKARIHSSRMDELFEQLGRLGKVVEPPQPKDAAGIVELEIEW